MPCRVKILEELSAYNMYEALVNGTVDLFLTVIKNFRYLICIRKVVNCVVCRSASLDVEPLYTFRCHTGPVLCLAMSATGEQCYSGGLDGAIHCWNLPCANIDPYDSFGMCTVVY
jgi:WD40 repeat protein